MKPPDFSRNYFQQFGLKLKLIRKFGKEKITKCVKFYIKVRKLSEAYHSTNLINVRTKLVFTAKACQ